jgi:hypothetical protein
MQELASRPVERFTPMKKAEILADVHCPSFEEAKKHTQKGGLFSSPPFSVHGLYSRDVLFGNNF